MSTRTPGEIVDRGKGWTLDPERALGHPAWWAALGVLAVNDHLLKGSGLLPGVVTGKLSDAAGLFLAPALLATVARARGRRALIACHVAVAAVFAALELWPAAAAAWRLLLGGVGIPWHAWADPTDLLALPFVALGFRVLAPEMRRPARATAGSRSPSALEIAGLGAGLALCVATSPYRLPQAQAPGEAGKVLADAFVHVLEGETEIAVHLRLPKAPLDCDRLLRDPGGALSPDLFEDEASQRSGLVFASANQALWPPPRSGPAAGQRCAAVLMSAEQSTWLGIGSDELPPTYIIWDTVALPVRPIPEHSRPNEELPEGAVVLREGEDGLEIRARGPVRVVPAGPVR